jgi:hypothetical protein
MWGCGPAIDQVPSGTDSDAQGSTTETTETTAASTTASSSDGADESTSTGDEPTVEFPPRLLVLRETIEGGKVLELVEFGDDGDLEPRPLHPELGSSILVEEYEVLTGTELVAFRARPAEDEPARLYVARADVGAPGSASEIDVDGDVTELAWVSGARTLVVATSTTTYRVEMTATASAPPVEMPAPSAPADLSAIDAEGMRITADFGAVGEPKTCFVASVDPTAPTDWTSAYDGPDTDCYVDGFGPDALVFTTGGDSPPLSLWRRRYVDGVLQPAVLLAADADYVVHVGPHGVAYRTDGDARELFYVPAEGGEIGEAQRLSDEGVDVLLGVSKNQRQLIFAEGGVMKLVDLERSDVSALPLALPSPYTGTGLFIALSLDGVHAFAMGHHEVGEYWQDTLSLWRLDISGGIATDPLLITETSETGPEVNSGSIEAIELAPDGGAIVYSRLGGYNGTLGDVVVTDLGPSGAIATTTLDDEATNRLTYSADGQWLAVGQVTVYTRAGEPVFGGSAVDWKWWEPIDD